MGEMNYSSSNIPCYSLFYPSMESLNQPKFLKELIQIMNHHFRIFVTIIYTTRLQSSYNE